jgi:hypothetical protein
MVAIFSPTLETLHAISYRREFYLRIENPPYMALVIGATPEPGPLGSPGISVAHYGEQNGDLMRDPGMCFELTKVPFSAPALVPYYGRNDCFRRRSNQA